MVTEDRVFKLNVFVTNRCNRGCRHCLVRATDSGRKYLKPEWVRKLVLEAKDLGYKLQGSISAMGEPLMNRDVVKIAEAFSGLKICRDIIFITSGFLAKDEGEKQLFQELINSHFREILTINFSFNLYAPAFSERLQESISVMFKNNNFSRSHIRIVCDRNNYFKTINELIEILYSLQTRMGMKWSPALYCMSDEFRFKSLEAKLLNLSKRPNWDFSEERELQLAGDAFSIPSIQRFESEARGEHYLFINVGLVSRIGRARNLPEACFFGKNFRCRLIFGKQLDDILYMGPDGEIFPDCNCTLSGLQIGTWETPLQELLTRRRILHENLVGKILSDRKLCWNREHPCDVCATLAKRNFSFVGK